MDFSKTNFNSSSYTNLMYIELTFDYVIKLQISNKLYI